MHWIALLPTEDERRAWACWALRFTPRVTRQSEALLLEITASERLWGGRRALLHSLLREHPFEQSVPWAQGGQALLALALLRLKAQGAERPAAVPDGLPLQTLDAARAHVGTLARLGCRSWGALRALPRDGVARRFGDALLQALDCAYGERTDSHAWLQLPERFDEKVELPALATSAPELMWSTARLLARLQAWLQARQRGVLAFGLEWTLDLRRLDGVELPRQQRLVIRTAQPTQDMAHLKRLAGEQLARSTLQAPANALRLRALETAAWAGGDRSLLPHEGPQGERLHELVERLSARLGPAQVLCSRPQADHRPEAMQHWVPAQGQTAALLAASAAPRAGAPLPAAAAAADALYPAWLLPAPLPLSVDRRGKPHHQGPLQLLSRPQRIEAVWWDGRQRPALRDYFIAQSEAAGLLWIYREHVGAHESTGQQAPAEYRWFLHGIYG